MKAPAHVVHAVQRLERDDRAHAGHEPHAVQPEEVDARLELRAQRGAVSVSVVAVAHDAQAGPEVRRDVAVVRQPGPVDAEEGSALVRALGQYAEAPAAGLVAPAQRPSERLEAEADDEEPLAGPAAQRLRLLRRHRLHARAPLERLAAEHRADEPRDDRVGLVEAGGRVGLRERDGAGGAVVQGDEHLLLQATETQHEDARGPGVGQGRERLRAERDRALEAGILSDLDAPGAKLRGGERPHRPHCGRGGSLRPQRPTRWRSLRRPALRPATSERAWPVSTLARACSPPLFGLWASSRRLRRTGEQFSCRHQAERDDLEGPPFVPYWDGTTSAELVQLTGCTRDGPADPRPSPLSPLPPSPPALPRPLPLVRACRVLWPWPRSSAPVALGREPPPVDQRPGGWRPNRGGAWRGKMTQRGAEDSPRGRSGRDLIPRGLRQAVARARVRLSNAAWRLSPRAALALSLGFLAAVLLGISGFVFLPSATLQLVCRHDFQSADITVWIDGEVVHTDTLTGAVGSGLGF